MLIRHMFLGSEFTSTTCHPFKSTFYCIRVDFIGEIIRLLSKYRKGVIQLFTTFSPENDS